LTTAESVGILSNVKATELLRRKIVYSENSFAELVLWRVPEPLPGSRHSFKYRLAYVVNGECVLRFDNEAGKGDHRHVGGKEGNYTFSTPEKLIADFQREIARWNNENRNA
jgi:Family of unknown function (DUF6516)